MPNLVKEIVGKLLGDMENRPAEKAVILEEWVRLTAVEAVRAVSRLIATSPTPEGCASYRDAVLAAIADGLDDAMRGEADG